MLKNIIVKNCNIKASTAGAIVGKTHGTVKNCKTDGGTIGKMTAANVGGIVGVAKYNAIIEGNENNAHIFRRKMGKAFRIVGRLIAIAPFVLSIL